MVHIEILISLSITGGMLVMKLDRKDLQFEKMDPFDGTMAYAQNKRQQVIMTEKWAEKHKEIFFSSMHPGGTLTSLLGWNSFSLSPKLCFQIV